MPSATPLPLYRSSKLHQIFNNPQTAFIHSGSFTIPGVKRKITTHKVDPNMRQTAAMAEQRGASISYVQALRDGVCSIFMEQQSKHLRSLPDGNEQCGTLELAFDETELKVSVPQRLPSLKKTKFSHIEVPTMIAHGVLSWPGRDYSSSILFPARGLVNKTGGDMLAMINGTLQDSCGGIDALASKLALLCVIIVSDAAKANKALVRSLAASVGHNTLVLHLLCFMHQVSLAVGNCYTPLQVLGPVFCGCNLLRRGRWQAVVENAVRRFPGSQNKETTVEEGKTLWKSS